MLVYNTLIAIAVGSGLIGTALFGQLILKKRAIESEGWAVFFAIVGAIMTILGLGICLTWPYGQTGFEYANIEFGEPPVAFGLLCIFWAVYLWRNRVVFTDATAAGIKNMNQRVVGVLKPISLFVFATGAMMTALAIAWLRFQLGAAPTVEPISGLFAPYPLFEATFLFVLWGLVAVGALLFPLAIYRRSATVYKTVFITWMLAGIVFLGFGALNFYTHIGMYTNIHHGTNYKI